jgi:hypothetical protein
LKNGLNNTKNKAMKKTLRQWFDMFPEPYRKQAIENTIELEGKERLEETDKNAVEAINGGFVWKQSPQGHDYWSEFAFKIYRNEITLIERAERMYSEDEVRQAIKKARDISDGKDCFDAEDISGCTEVCTYGWKFNLSEDLIIEQFKKDGGNK